MMEAVRTSKTPVYSSETIRRYIPKGSNLSNSASCIHGFFMILRTNNDYFLKDH